MGTPLQRLMPPCPTLLKNNPRVAIAIMLGIGQDEDAIVVDKPVRARGRRTWTCRGRVPKGGEEVQSVRGCCRESAPEG